MDNKLKLLSEIGVDVRFRETAVSHGHNSLEENYFPELFGDDGFEEAKQALLRRVQAETKASVEVNTSSFLNRAPLKKREVPVDPNGRLSRWKIAFKDSSKEVKAPTVICTRDGR
jgi:hypothetical protein